MAHKITLQPSGHEFFAEDEEIILDAALRHGFAFPYSCRSGLCGKCRAIITEGMIEYDDYEPDELDEEEIAAGVAYMCQSMARSDLVINIHEIDSPTELEIKRIPCKIQKMNRLTSDVMQLFLKLPENESLQFLAGQYIDFILPDGRHRSFSIANAPHDKNIIELHIRHIEGGEFTDMIFEKSHEKDIMRIEGPHGDFFLREDSDRPIILVATGTGFAPVKGIIEHALEENIDREIHLFWGARTMDGLYMNDLAESWVKKNMNLKYTPVLSRPDANWQGATGYVQNAVLATYPDLSEHEVYSCGLPEMVKTSYETFCTAGLTQDRFFSDAFEFAVDKKKTETSN
ncbi:MAG: CDP-6-deoxy-delta-3,4-glucoseen reductase [Gammaproteobacteria bacterium]|nr:CDP-6-deoxy-delta-3,4-glucoseen reductase [Gammaproteobacteria bacterium]